MPDRNPLRSTELEYKALLWLVMIVTFLFALILWPFAGAVCWAVFIALVFWPLHQRLQQRVAGMKGRPSLAALVSLAIILVIVILPLGFMAGSITQEASVLVEKLRSGEIQVGRYFQSFVDMLPEWLRGILARFGLADLAALQQKALASLGQSGQAITAQAFVIGASTLDFVVSFFVMLYLLFFLLRDGRALSLGISRSIPLKREHTDRLLTQFAVVVRATVKGNIVVALVQGALGGLAFWVLGVPGAMLWAAVMAVLSLLPAVGAALVWGPVALYFLASGQIVQAIGLTLWGVLAIGLVDNVLRPVLVGKDTRMPDYLVLIATLGGIAIFGLNGFVIGPVIAAVFLVSWEMLEQARRTEDV